MNPPELSDELRRFIYSIASIPHLEAMLLLHHAPNETWDATTTAQRLYLAVDQVTDVLSDLAAAGICNAVADQPGKYQYAPAFNELNELIAQLARYYSRNLIEVTNMIHSKAKPGRRVQLFADAFKFNKDK